MSIKVDLSGHFGNIYILESRLWWDACKDKFNSSTDLILTYDFGLKKDVEILGGNALFLDHLVDQDVMQKNNFLIYDFFRCWNLDENGNDFFIFRDVSFGFSFRIDIWNDFTFYLRVRICLDQLFKTLSFDAVYVGMQVGTVELVLNELNIVYQKVGHNGQASGEYYFPIFRYMHENTRSFSLKSHLKDWFMLFQGSLMLLWDRLPIRRSNKPLLFIQEYHPTRKILEYLRKSGNYRILVERISATAGLTRYIKERPIPLWRNRKKFNDKSESLLQRFCNQRCSRLLLFDGSDVTESVYKIIEEKIKPEMLNQICTLNSIINYVDSNPVSLEVLISNVGRFPSLLDCVLKERSVCSYFIINGMLGSAYLDEAKYATVINGYSESIKEHYFKNMDNIVCLGDPRMDAYTPITPRKIRGDGPVTITIGTSGFNPVDLNSYVAVEFAFLYDVLQALSIVKERGIDLRIVIKVRPNGYLAQYKKFVKEYFSGDVSDIVDTVPVRDVLKKTDLYISIYSQTLFEASCMGIPVLYYRKDNEIMDPPFDGNSELVTVDQVDSLVTAVTDFYSEHERFDSFMQQQVMEKYIGALDGGNLLKNIDFIKDLIGVGGQG